MRKHEREWVELACGQEAELCHLWAELSTELQESLKAAHQAELLQAQVSKCAKYCLPVNILGTAGIYSADSESLKQEQHGLELDARWLSLGEQQVAQLERTQDGQQHDGVVMLSELQASLCARGAQESTLQEALLEKQHTTEMEVNPDELPGIAKVCFVRVHSGYAAFLVPRP